MNDYWHIPRASLAPSSNSSAVSSASSTHRSHKSHSNLHAVGKRATPPQRQQHYKTHMDNINAGGAKQKRRDSDMSATSAAATAAAAAAVLATAAAKRGSRSSQGSSDSNNSTRSAASGSLLLTAANLERFAAIHKQEQKHNNKLYIEGVMPTVHNSNTAATTTVTTTTPMPTIYNANLVHAIMHQQQQQQPPHQQMQQYKAANSTPHSNSNNEDGDIIITMDPNLDFIKTKDLDSVSIASSMHFTMVNGETERTNALKRGLCDRGRQVTVLIISMSLIFLLLIMGMVYALEMRAREMPQS